MADRLDPSRTPPRTHRILHLRAAIGSPCPEVVDPHLRRHGQNDGRWAFRSRCSNSVGEERSSAWSVLPWASEAHLLGPDSKVASAWLLDAGTDLNRGHPKLAASSRDVPWEAVFGENRANSGGNRSKACRHQPAVGGRRPECGQLGDPVRIRIAFDRNYYPHNGRRTKCGPDSENINAISVKADPVLSDHIGPRSVNSGPAFGARLFLRPTVPKYSTTFRSPLGKPPRPTRTRSRYSGTHSRRKHMQPAPLVAERLAGGVSGGACQNRRLRFAKCMPQVHAPSVRPRMPARSPETPLACAPRTHSHEMCQRKDLNHPLPRASALLRGRVDRVDSANMRHVAHEARAEHARCADGARTCLRRQPRTSKVTTWRVSVLAGRGRGNDRARSRHARAYAASAVIRKRMVSNVGCCSCGRSLHVDRGGAQTPDRPLRPPLRLASSEVTSQRDRSSSAEPPQSLLHQASTARPAPCLTFAEARQDVTTAPGRACGGANEIGCLPAREA